MVEILSYIMILIYSFVLYSYIKFRKLIQRKIEQDILQNLATNIFPNFHFGHAIFTVYIQRYHSPPTQVFIKLEKSYNAACLNNWVIIVRSINFINLKFEIQFFEDEKICSEKMQANKPNNFVVLIRNFYFAMSRPQHKNCYKD